MITRREFAARLAQAGAAAMFASSGLLTACGGLGSGTSSNSNSNSGPDSSSGQTTLQAAAKSRNLLYGAAVRSDELQNDKAFADAFTAQCAMLVPEVELQWNILETSPGVLNFAGADFLSSFAQQHGMQFRGHSLVPAGEFPKWIKQLTDRNQVIDQITTHVTTVVQHYAGHVVSWDVVNEAVNPSDGLANGLRNSFWMQVVGEEYIDVAFKAAAAADPAALLVYNDFGLEYDTPDSDQRRADVLALLQRLLQRGVPVHGLGFQAHLYGDANSINPSKLTDYVNQVSQLGLKIFITEMDVNDQALAGDLTIRDTQVADMYTLFLNAVLQNTALTEVTTWGLSDRYTWMVQHAPRADGLPPRPLPLDSDLKPKLAFDAIVNAFKAAPSR